MKHQIFQPANEICKEDYYYFVLDMVKVEDEVPQLQAGWTLELGMSIAWSDKYINTK